MTSQVNALKTIELKGFRGNFKSDIKEWFMLPRHVRFKGRVVLMDEDVDVYVTEAGALVVLQQPQVQRDGNTYEMISIFKRFEIFAKMYPADIVGHVAAELDVDYVEEIE